MRISDWSSDVCSSDLLGEDQVERGLVALAVGDEDLDGNPRRAGADGSDHRSELPGAAVGEVVTGDAGDHREAQSHALRSEERRVAQESFSRDKCRWSPYHKKKKQRRIHHTNNN